MPTATATDKNPSHHVTLSDGSTTYGFVLVDGQGNINERAITRTAVPQTGIKTTQGSTKYADLEFPSVALAQDDWSSGRGSDDFDNDRTRFADSNRLISRHQNLLMNGPQETYTSGYRDLSQYMPGKLTWQTLTGSTRYLAYKFTTLGAYTAGAIYLWIRRRGSPGTLTVELRADSGGNPGSVLQTRTITTSTITDTVSRLYNFNISDHSLSGTTSYWVVIYGAAGDDADDHWEAGTDADDTRDLTKSSSAGSSWANASLDLYFRVVDNSTDIGGMLFEYKGSMYAVMNIYTGTPRLYINGFKGVATGGSQATTTLGDSSQSFTTDELQNGTIILYEGTGSDVGKVWGTVSGNTDTVITYDAMDNAPVADSTLYSIIGMPGEGGGGGGGRWIEISGHGLTGPITDVAVFGDYVYFAQGDGVLLRFMREFNSNGTLTREYGNGGSQAVYLKVVHDPQKGSRIWAATNRDHLGRRSVSSSKAEAGTLFFARSIEDAEDVWTAGANVTVTSSSDNIVGAASVKMTVADGASQGQVLAYETISSVSFYGMNTFRWWFKSTVELTENDLRFRVSTSSDASTTFTTDFPFPDVEADVWTLVTLPFVVDSPDWRKITSVGVAMAVDKGAFNLWIDAVMVSPGPEFGAYIQLPEGFGRLTGLEAYGDPEELWVFREGQVGRITNGIFTPLPLREMSNARSRYNGRASTSHGVYLYFSFLQGLERYYRNNLDDMGPDRDRGLPNTRKGPIGSLISYPGRLLAAIETNGLGTYASILEYNLVGWHEIYRAPELGQTIWDMQIQVIPGAPDRIWFIQGRDILWIPLPGLTLREATDTSFTFTHEGVLESGWISANMREMEKFYKSIRIIVEDASSGNQEVEVDYRTDGSSTWVPLPTTFTSFRQEVDFTSTAPPNVTGRRLRYRLRLQTNDNTKTPKVKATVVEAVVRVPIKYTYTMAFIAQDDNKDIESKPDSYPAAETLVSQLDVWASSATVLKMRCNYSPYDNKEVLLDPASLRPIYVDMGNQKEGHTGQLTVVEI